MEFRELGLTQQQHFDGIVKILLNGLMTDGAHHKQYVLESALRLICEDSWVDEAKEELEWEDGIPA